MHKHFIQHIARNSVTIPKILDSEKSIKSKTLFFYPKIQNICLRIPSISGQ